MEKFIALYARVSSDRQDLRSQLPDLANWKGLHASGQPTKIFGDTASGKTMDRPGWKRLEAELLAGRLSKLVVWRLDRLGRTAAGLTALFEQLQRLQVGFVSVRDGVDLSTLAGRLMACVLASVAAYETEVRADRIAAGQAAARAAGKRWGGSQKGRRLSVTPEQIATIQRMHADGSGVSSMARTTQLSRPMIYGILRESGCKTLSTAEEDFDSVLT